MVRRFSIEGDWQAGLAGHGGENRAVFAFQMNAYRYWERFPERKDFIFGQFRKNFTVEESNHAF
jgi:MOSC domain-containing protein YiiM